jgi:hypothetical protein
VEVDIGFSGWFVVNPIAPRLRPDRTGLARACVAFRATTLYHISMSFGRRVTATLP